MDVIPPAPSEHKPLGHLFVGITSNRVGLTHKLGAALEYATVQLFTRRWLVTKATTGSSDLEDARNQLFSVFYNGQFTHALFLDDDVHWDGDAIWRLATHPVDMVLGAYPKRGDAEGYPISMLDNEIQFVNPITREPDPKNGLLKVAGGPAGLMRISRACAEKMVAAYPDDWYHQPEVPGTKRAWDMFQFEVRDHIRYSEDKNFCRKWRAIGGEVWVDPHLTLHHHGDKTWTGCFGQYLRHVGLMRPEKVVKIDLVGGPSTPKKVEIMPQKRAQG